MKIDTAILNKLPKNFTFLREGQQSGMDGIKKDAILILWLGTNNDMRKGWFAIRDGEYLSEDFISSDGYY